MSHRSCRAKWKSGKIWFQIAPTIRYEFTGTKPAAISGKDIFLHIAGTHGDAANHNLEFGGPGLASVPMNDRRTIATQGAEISADYSTFPIDDLARDFLAAHGAVPASYQAAAPDPDAAYAAVRTVDLDALVPHVARPGTVSRKAGRVPAEGRSGAVGRLIDRIPALHWTPVTPDALLTDDQLIDGSNGLSVVHTPGRTPGHIVLIAAFHTFLGQLTSSQ